MDASEIREMLVLAKKNQETSARVTDLAVAELMRVGTVQARSRANNLRRKFAACEFAYKKVQSVYGGADFDALYAALDAHDKAVFALQDLQRLVLASLTMERNS